MMDPREWDNLIKGKIKRLLYQSINPGGLSMSGYVDMESHRRELDKLVAEIEYDVREYCRKLSDSVCESHHFEGEVCE